MDRVQVIGVYNVDEAVDVFLIEVNVQAAADEFGMEQFTQEMPGKSQGHWQVAYDEHYLNPDGDKVIGKTFHKPLSGRRPTRVAFFLHYVEFSRPMLTPFGPVSLPQPTPMPERLAQSIRYEEPD